MLNITNLLIQLNLFRGFHTEEVQIISHHISLQRFFQGQILMQKGQPGTYLGILLKGSVNAIDNHKVLTTRQAGELVGEMSLVRSEPRSADVVAVSDGEIAILTFDEIESLKRTHANIAIKLLRMLTESVVQILAAREQKDTTEYIALIADRAETSELVDFVTKNKLFFGDRAIAGPLELKEDLAQRAGIVLDKIIDSHRLIGNAQALGSLIVSGNIQAIIYLRDSLETTANQLDFESLSRLCDLNRIPFATNLATAEAILYYLEG